MDERALDVARKRVADAREGRFETTRLEAALVRARAQIDALTTASDELRERLPDQVGDAVQEGLRRQVVPIARTLAEIKGLVNQANRRLERVEQEILAERSARIDDLSVLVDLVASGWRGVDERLNQIEARRPFDPGDIVPLHGGVAGAEEPARAPYAQTG
jgi:hypothetical protein